MGHSYRNLTFYLIWVFQLEQVAFRKFKEMFTFTYLYSVSSHQWQIHVRKMTVFWRTHSDSNLMCREVTETVKARGIWAL
jgi:hypothetical protein